MTKARDLADLISAGNALADGAINVSEISDLTATAAEINKLDGLTATTAELNNVVGSTSSLQSQLNNVSVTSGSLTKTFTNGESATITLSQSITPAPVVEVTKEVAQTGVSSKGNWDVDATASNYDLHNTAYSTTLTPSNASTDGTFTLGTGSFASTDVGKQIEGNGGVAILTGTNGSYSIVTNFTDTSAIASGSWSMSGIKSAGASTGLSMSGLATSGDYSVIESASGHSATRSTSNHISGGNQGMFIGDNGTKLYVVNSTDDTVYQWDFGTAWDLSTVPNGATASKAVGGNDGGPVDIHFKSDGTVMYMAGQDGDRVHQYNLSTAWAVNTASHNGSFSVYASTRVNGGFNGFYFKPDGTRFWTVCRNTDRVTEWQMTTAWDVTSGSYVRDTPIASIDTFPYDIQFTTDGLTVYIGGDNSKLRKWNLTTAWDFSTGTHDTTFNKTIYSTSASGGFYISDDETRMYINDAGGTTVYQFDIGQLIQPTSQYHIGVTNSSGQIDSQYWTDINSMTADQTLGDYGEAYYAVSTDDRTTWSVAKASDGVRPIVRNNAGTWQYNSQESSSTVGWDVANGTYDNKNRFLDGSINGFEISNDGTKIYYVKNNLLTYQRTLSTAYDVSTAGAESSLATNSQDADPRDVTLSADGTKMYMLGDTNNTIFQYTLSTAWDITTATYASKSFNMTSQDTSPFSVDFKYDGTRMWVLGNQSKYIYQFDLSTAWDVSTASYNNVSFLTTSAGLVSAPKGIVVKSDGSELYMVDSDYDRLYVYDFGTNFDLSTLTYSNTAFDHTGQTTNPRDIAFSNDGQKMYVIDFSNYVYQYSTDTTVITYSTNTTWTNATTNDEFYALQEALGATSVNRMDKTQLDAVADGSHFTLGDTLDLMIALKQDTAATTVPSSDGVTINYDAATINQGAVLGTDYDFDFPANNKVRITSNAAQNLKIRVV